MVRIRQVTENDYDVNGKVVTIECGHINGSHTLESN